MNKKIQPLTKKDLETTLEKTLESQSKVILEAVSDKFDKVDEKFKKVDRRFEKVDKKIKEKFDKVLTGQDKICKQLTNQAIEIEEKL